MPGLPRNSRPPHPATIQRAEAPHPARIVQSKATPAPSAPRGPHAAKGAVLQRQVALDALQAMCTTLFGSYTKAVEFQAMSIDNTVTIAGNKYTGGVAALEADIPDWNGPKTTTMLGATVLGDTGVTKGREIKTATDATAAATKNTKAGVILLLNDLEAGGNNLHAEQKLLHVVAERMRIERPFGMNVRIAGRNPPCDSCREVLVAFSKAYYDCGYGTLTYDTTRGQARGPAQLDLATLYPDAEFRFGDFVGQYTRALG
ncbi:hypothetical protein [Polyangium fumosum]|uniref:Uncharacterized protein n=1 Tax=Polyangium fumosum TaxID=889272 RepID=A0A4V5PLP2_9BACT|nr:hypothetical protein [Polyangium fumosum]TKC93040.1 hypothetical protein E8A74_49935 [Polyangium fumosum]